MQLLSLTISKFIYEISDFFTGTNRQKNLAAILKIGIPFYIFEYVVYRMMGTEFKAIPAISDYFIGFILFNTIIIFLIKKNRVNRETVDTSSNQSGSTNLSLSEYLKKHLFRVTWDTIRTTIFIVVGFILLIIPGVYLVAKLFLAPIAAQDDDIKEDTLKYSYTITTGHFFSLIFLIFAFVIIYATGLGMLDLLFSDDTNEPTVPYMLLFPAFELIFGAIVAFVSFSVYETLKEHEFNF